MADCQHSQPGWASHQRSAKVCMLLCKIPHKASGCESSAAPQAATMCCCPKGKRANRFRVQGQQQAAQLGDKQGGSQSDVAESPSFLQLGRAPGNGAKEVTSTGCQPSGSCIIAWAFQSPFLPASSPAMIISLILVVEFFSLTQVAQYCHVWLRECEIWPFFYNINAAWDSRWEASEMNFLSTVQGKSFPDNSAACVCTCE